ncbi:DUF1761 domain-containing protein [Hoeflea sp. G2-23]|uniref:DUF1761 domain-containing protein n=1 Tax=Hoeflea algicola TaxID=2983763 RepID=A0ABT3Z3N9_9HYPH|nr:DUF1761 domain-containing protein [Hoeflea algicola]MCY0146385.1 DUF1761 domain-containing protein [Hoeflea algicola]
MSEITMGVSWLAVIIGAVVSFLAGWLWYSPMLFGPKWAKGVGVEMGTASEMPFAAMAAQLVGLLLMSWFVGVTAVSNALWTAILATLAFTVLTYSGGLFTKKSSYARTVDAGYWIVALVIMVLCQGLLGGM